MPSIKRAPVSELTIKTPKEIPAKFALHYNNPNEFMTLEEALNVAKAQLRQYETNPRWRNNNNVNDEIDFLRYERIPRLKAQIEARKPLCQKFTNTITGTVKSVCGIQRQRTRKNRAQRKKTRRVR